MANYQSAQVESALPEWGRSLAAARKRRRWSQKNFANRLGVSISTIKRLEEGNSGVGIGVFASALWLLGLLDQTGTSFDIYHDNLGISIESESARGKGSADDF